MSKAIDPIKDWYEAQGPDIKAITELLCKAAISARMDTGWQPKGIVEAFETVEVVARGACQLTKDLIDGNPGVPEIPSEKELQEWFDAQDISFRKVIFAWGLVIKEYLDLSVFRSKEEYSARMLNHVVAFAKRYADSGTAYYRNEPDLVA